MTKIKRNIIKIDESKCDGCGMCVPACKEGALQIIDGKARLVSEIYCDGLGACLGECPRGAITIEERDAEKFDEKAVTEHMKKQNVKGDTKNTNLPCGCPGTMAKSLGGEKTADSMHSKADSELRNWPIQLKLIPLTAPYLRGSDIILLADCSAVAYPNLHRDFLKNRVVIMACPKLDDREFYIDKLSELFKQNNVRSIEVVMMEVPCCSGLSDMVDRALTKSGVKTKKFDTVIGLDGKRLN